MSVTSVLSRGLSIVANCKAVTGDIWHAHYGVAAIASTFFVRENELSKNTVKGIEEQTEAMLIQHEWPQFVITSAEVEYSKAENIILDALEQTIDELHWVGHNVIYASLSLAAIQVLGIWGTLADITRISELIRSFERTIPGRSWLGYSTKEVKMLELEENDNFPSITNATELSEFILKELAAFKLIVRAEAHHDLIGHMLTYSNALNILFDLGHQSLFIKGLPPLLKLVKVLRGSRNLDLDNLISLTSPIDRLPLVKTEKSRWLPIESQFWDIDYSDQDWDFGHVFKFSYSFYNHLCRAPQLLELTSDNFRYIVL